MRVELIVIVRDTRRLVDGLAGVDVAAISPPEPRRSAPRSWRVLLVDFLAERVLASPLRDWREDLTYKPDQNLVVWAKCIIVVGCIKTQQWLTAVA